MDELAQQERSIRQKMLNNDASFVERALRLLRPEQRERAMEVLRKHGYGSKGP
jgi:DNA-binding MurR/RpiR family transcriptional regulator